MIDFISVRDRLLFHRVVSSTLAANVSAAIAIQFYSGINLDFTKLSVRVHQRRLRLIGIDINPHFKYVNKPSLRIV